MKVEVAIMNAFVDGEHGGNPAGVVLGAEQYSRLQKLDIARQVGLSETAFVSKSQQADFKLDFFTPEKQIAHCGHATIATFSYLSQLGLVTNNQSSKETIDGNRAVEVNGNYAYMEQLAPQYRQLSDQQQQAVQDALGLTSDMMIAPPMIANTGNGFMLVAVKSISQLEEIVPNDSMISDISRQFDLIGFYVFTLETNQADRDASTRMFAPYYGIKEESATGMAAGPLACALYDHFNINKSRMLIEQGYAMKPMSPSCIEVVLSLDNHGIQGLKAGGIGKAAKQLTLEIA